MPWAASDRDREYMVPNTTGEIVLNEMKQEIY